MRKHIQVGNLQIDLLQHRVRLDGKEIDLTTKEFALLSFLAANAGRVFSREQLLEQVWGYNYYGDARTVDVHIRHLREKLEEDPGNPELIITVWVPATVPGFRGPPPASPAGGGCARPPSGRHRNSCSPTPAPATAPGRRPGRHWRPGS